MNKIEWRRDDDDGRWFFYDRIYRIDEIPGL